VRVWLAPSWHRILPTGSKGAQRVVVRNLVDADVAPTGGAIPGAEQDRTADLSLTEGRAAFWNQTCQAWPLNCNRHCLLDSQRSLRYDFSLVTAVPLRPLLAHLLVEKMSNPYQELPENAFWKLAVANRSPFDLADVWSPKFHIQPDARVVTFGSCFAQHIGQALGVRGFTWYSAEPPPAELILQNAKRFNYNVFSARTGNIYTTSLLLQWTRWALERAQAPDDIWLQKGRAYDPFRPSIEPQGFGSSDEAIKSRFTAIKAFRRCIVEAEYFVFTLGLTERWADLETGWEYPVCPGTVAGEYNPKKHAFENQDYATILENLENAFDMMTAANPNLRFIVTVSPVPLTATKSGNHVMMATMESKSILRAVAGRLSQTRDAVDYFPSYELINSPVIRGMFFEPNQREVNPRGVAFVMDHFFRALEAKYGSYKIASRSQPGKVGYDKIVCEEEMLEAFGERQKT